MKVGRTQFDRTVAAVQASGADAKIEEVLRSGRGGRPRQTRMDVYLAGMIVTMMSSHRLTLVNVHKMLTQGLPDSAQRHYGIRWTDNGVRRRYTYKQMTYPLAALKEKLSTPEATEEETLQAIMDKIVATSLPDHLSAPAAVALDATGIQSWGRGKTDRLGAELPDDDTIDATDADVPRVLRRANDSLCAFDKDARWGYRTRTYSNGSSLVFGFNMFSIVGIPLEGQPKDTMPILTHGIAVRSANAYVAEPGLALLDAYRDSGAVLSQSLSDRAFAYAKPDDWAYRLRDREIEQILDLHPSEHGARDFEGIRMVDGAPHCPSMPDELVHITRPTRFSVGQLRKNPTRKEIRRHTADTEALAEFRARIVERQTWAFRRVAGPDINGKERWECPAQAGRRVCANCPMSQLLGPDVPTVGNPPTGAGKPKCCTQRTVTVPGNVTPKIRQRLYWGSDEWIASYNRRTYVEGAFGNSKNAFTENVTRGWCAVMGLVKTSRLLAVAVAATNIRLLRLWAKRTGDFTAPMSVPDPEYQPWEEIDENGAILTHDPPSPVAA